MFEIEHFIVFLSAGLLLNISPGPDMIYVATQSSTQGRLAGIISSLGIGTGSLLHIIATAIGLSALIFYSSIAYEIVKWVGAIYLIYLGIKSIKNADRKIDFQTNTLNRDEEKLLTVFRKGILVNVLNPQVALFFLAFLPQFVNPNAPYFTINIILLGLIFNICGTLINIIVAYFFAAIGDWLKGKTMLQKFKSWLSGTVYIILGIGIAASEK
jgi:threonine/homoserine/homoserine lactone efflux protein